MLTLAAGKEFCGCFSCTVLRLHSPPPTISSGRGVPCSHSSLSWGGGSTGKTLWCISGWKLISNVSEVFRVNTTMWEIFSSSLSPVVGFHSSQYLAGFSLVLQEALSHFQRETSLCSMYCASTSQHTSSLSCPGICKCSDYCGKENQGKAPFGLSLSSTGWVQFGWECEPRAAQEERQSQQTSGRANKPHILFVIKVSFHVC